MTIDLTCPYCNFSKKIPREKVPDSAKTATCPRCRRQFEIFPSNSDKSRIRTTGETQHPGSEKNIERDTVREAAPWENISELGLWQAIYHTIKEVLFAPDAFFKKLTYNGGIKEPLAFGLLTGSIGAIFGVFWQFLIFSGGVLPFEDFIACEFTFGLFFLIALVFIPIAVVVGQFITSAVWHVFLLLTKGAGNGFEATFRVVSYSQSVQILALIPVLGGWVSGIWQIVIQIIGMKEIHETTYLKVFLAFLIPLVGVIFLVIIAITLLLVFLGKQNFGQLCF